MAEKGPIKTIDVVLAIRQDIARLEDQITRLRAAEKALVALVPITATSQPVPRPTSSVATVRKYERGVDAAILTALRAAPRGLRGCEIAKAARRHQTTISPRLKAFERRGLIRKMSRGLYAPTEALLNAPAPGPQGTAPEVRP